MDYRENRIEAGIESDFYFSQRNESEMSERYQRWISGKGEVPPPTESNKLFFQGKQYHFSVPKGTDYTKNFGDEALVGSGICDDTNVTMGARDESTHAEALREWKSKSDVGWDEAEAAVKAQSKDSADNVYSLT